jgi:hypothetical protein
VAALKKKTFTMFFLPLFLHCRDNVCDAQSGQKPFSCDKCPYATAERSALIRHQRTHTSTRPFACPFCDYRSAQSCGLVRHKAARHPNEVVAFATVAAAAAAAAVATDAASSSSSV